MSFPLHSSLSGDAASAPAAESPEDGIVVPDDGRLLERLAVLSVEGIGYHLTQRPADGWLLHVVPEDLARARQALTSHERQHRDWPPAPLPDGLSATARPGEGLWAAFWGCHILGLFYLWLGPYRASHQLLRSAGAWRAGLRAGEWWRAVTALMVHADIGHLSSNLLFLFWYAALTVRRFGSGLGWFLIVAAGAVGNIMAAWLGPRATVGIGASTGCFGALGLLAADGVVAHIRRVAPWRDIWRRAWLPLGAGLALLGMTGAAPGTDVTAHLAGFVAGLGLGGLAAGVSRRPPGVKWQWALAALTAAIVAASWGRAWQAAA